MQADLWGWFNRYAAQANLEGNPLKQRLVQVYFEAQQMLRVLGSAEPAIKLYEEGVQMAQRMGEPCWELFYEHQISEALIHESGDYINGRDHAVRVAARAYQSAP